MKHAERARELMNEAEVNMRAFDTWHSEGSLEWPIVAHAAVRAILGLTHAVLALRESGRDAEGPPNVHQRVEKPDGPHGE